MSDGTAAGTVCFDLEPGAAGSEPYGIVATKDGAQMLKASTPTEILITLPEALPRDFTIEFDIIPKQCCNPEDLAFEGKATLSQSSGSARVLWHPDAQTVMGGGAHYQSATPADLRETTRGQLTHIVASFEGETFKLYTNGRRLYTLTDRRFARGRVLRVFLGGQDDADQAVYLARLRVVAGAATVIAATSGQSASTGTLVQSGGAIRAAGSGPLPATISGTPTAAPGVSAGATATGPVAASSATNPSTDTRLVLFAPPPQRSIRLTGFAGNGVSPPPSRKIAVTGFLGEGAPALNASRTIRLSGFAGDGGWEVAAPRTIRLTGYAGVGNARALTTSFRIVITEFPAPAPRSLLLPGFTGAGNFVRAPSRSIRLASFAGTSAVTAPAPRRITLPGYTWNGGANSAEFRVIRLSGWAGAGPTTTP